MMLSLLPYLYIAGGKLNRIDILPRYYLIDYIGGATDDNAEPTTESQLGGTQQSFNLRIEHNNINLLESKHSNINLLEPKNDSINNMLNSKQENLNNLLGWNKAHSRHKKQNCDKAASDYRELFDFDSSSFDAKNGDDLPHSITDAINEVGYFTSEGMIYPMIGI